MALFSKVGVTCRYDAVTIALLHLERSAPARPGRPPMAGDPISKLAAILDRYHLLEPAQLAEVTGPLAHSFPNLKGLAGELIRRGWLTPLQVNQIFQGRARDLLLESYVLLERIGEGGMGQVFKARNWKLN